jgi:hypothetical protein
VTTATIYAKSKGEMMSMDLEEIDSIIERWEKTVTEEKEIVKMYRALSKQRALDSNEKSRRDRARERLNDAQCNLAWYEDLRQAARR